MQNGSTLRMIKSGWSVEETWEWFSSSREISQSLGIWNVMKCKIDDILLTYPGWRCRRQFQLEPEVPTSSLLTWRNEIWSGCRVTCAVWWPSRSSLWGSCCDGRQILSFVILMKPFKIFVSQTSAGNRAFKSASCSRKKIPLFSQSRYKTVFSFYQASQSSW